MFVVADVDHAGAPRGSGLPAAGDTVVGYYSAARAWAAAPWRFISVDHRRLLGSRVGPGDASATAARAAFAASGWGDVSKAIRR